MLSGIYPNTNNSKKYGTSAWGPAAWTLLHGMASMSIVKSTDLVKFGSELLPCEDPCGKTFRCLQKMQQFRLHNELSISTRVTKMFNIHNEINRKLGKRMLRDIPVKLTRMPHDDDLRDAWDVFYSYASRSETVDGHTLDVFQSLVINPMIQQLSSWEHGVTSDTGLGLSSVPVDFGSVGDLHNVEARRFPSKKRRRR